jgi:hypothetical protein
MSSQYGNAFSRFSGVIIFMFIFTQLTAEVLGTYNFSSVTTTSGLTDPTAVPTNNGVTFGSFSAIGQTATNPNAASRFSFTNQPTGATQGSDVFSGTIATNQYYQVSLTVNSGYSLTLSSISFTVQRSGTGVRQYAVRSSIDAYSDNLPASVSANPTFLSVVPTNVFQIIDSKTSATSGNVITLPSTSYSNLSSGTTITFRFYGFNAEAAGGTFSIDDVSFEGTISPIATTFQTAGNWSTTSNWSNGIPGSGSTATIAAACTVDATVSAKSIIINPDASLTVNTDNILTAEDLTLKSNAAGTATLVNNGTLTLSKNATVEQYLDAERNWYISSPVNAGTLPTAGYEWNQSNGTWAGIISGSLMTPGKGYIVKTSSAGTFSFIGTLNDNVPTALLSRTAGVYKEGFNLVGNPYPSFLNWNSITKTNLSATMWYRTREGSAYKFYTYNGSAAGYGEGDGVGVPAGVTNLIPPMQAFWVRVESGNTTGTIGFENAARAHKDIAGNILKAPAATNRQIIRLTVSNGENTDETLIYTNSNATSGLDTYDSHKMMNAASETPDLYTIAGTEKLVINGLNALPLDTPIPLGLAPGKAGTFSISANELTNIDSNTTTAILHDAQVNANFDLSTGQTYDFATDGTATESRFSLILRSKGTTTGTSEPAEGKNMVYVDANHHLNVVIKGDISADATIQIYTVTGQQILKEHLIGSPIILQKSFECGVYIVKILNGGMESTKKITVK